MVGDQRGHSSKKEYKRGDVSSKAPLLDTLPFAASAFIFGQFSLLSDWKFRTTDGHGDTTGFLLIIHRTFNILGHRLGLKSVPY